MPPEDEKRRLTWEWLAKAREDILTADRAAQPPPLVDSVLFHCQQAAEKALKAYLTWNDQPFRRVHDLEELIRQGAAVNADMAALLEAGHTLSPYAVEPRYPSDDAEPTPADIEEARRLAGRVVDFILARLPPEVQP